MESHIHRNFYWRKTARWGYSNCTFEVQRGRYHFAIRVWTICALSPMETPILGLQIAETLKTGESRRAFESVTRWPIVP